MQTNGGGTSRRKAVARVRVVPGTGQWKINGATRGAPARSTSRCRAVPCARSRQPVRRNPYVCGGGVSGQTGALRGIARALVEIAEEEYRPT